MILFYESASVWNILIFICMNFECILILTIYYSRVLICYNFSVLSVACVSLALNSIRLDFYVLGISYHAARASTQKQNNCSEK